MKFLLLLSTTLCYVTYLYQSDFDEGTYLITQPGHYKLAENIVFNPNPAWKTGIEPCRAGMPLPQQFGKYNPRAFGIGFFAAISIQCSDVKLDLNGYCIEQSEEHSLLQKFYAHIELADQPFIPTQGPHNFGNTLLSATNVEICNGTLGLSSHHGIHGNNNHNVHIHDIVFENYEVAAVALNGAHHVKIEKCVGWSRIDIPVLGIHSSARFILQYVDKLAMTKPELTLKIQGVDRTVGEIQHELCSSLNAVYHDVLERGRISYKRHPKEYHLFHNRKGVVDGNCYGFLINNVGVAVEGFSRNVTEGRCHNITMENLTIKRAIGNIIEVPALNNNGTAMTDPLGAVFQTRNKNSCNKRITIDSKERYRGNVVANAQAIVAKGILSGCDFGHLDTQRAFSISQNIVEWIEAYQPMEYHHNKGYICNGDAMFHVDKGVNVFRIDSTDELKLENCHVWKAMNLGHKGNCKLCDYDVYEKSHPAASQYGYNGSTLRGFSFSDCTRFEVKNCSANYLETHSGSVYGFHVHGGSKYGNLEHVWTSNMNSGIAYNAKPKCMVDPNHEPIKHDYKVSDDCSYIVPAMSTGQ